MENPSRRAFLAQVGAALTAVETQPAVLPDRSDAVASSVSESSAGPIDFQFAPLAWQSTYCFPDDPYKSLVGSKGELLIGHPGTNVNIDAFSAVVEFTGQGMEGDRILRQELESPGTPIVHTFVERPGARWELIAFATNNQDEGRVDNVILDFQTIGSGEARFAPLVHVRTGGHMEAVAASDTATRIIGAEGECFLLANTPLTCRPEQAGWRLEGHALAAQSGKKLRLLFRFPQERQPLERIRKRLAVPSELLDESRQFWRQWSPFESSIGWRLSISHQNFVLACARNILQAREVKNGRKTFQTGPTVYRNLWVVDGCFILEAARYLGYDKEAQQGLEAMWSHQQPSGGVFAAVPEAHWKDTGIAMFTMVRQAELSQDWTYFRNMAPNLIRAGEFLREIRDQARGSDTPNGRYGLLAEGFGDGGLNGIRPEFTNTVWALAGLRAAIDAAKRLNLGGFEPMRQFYAELRTAFFEAARHEMRRHPNGFMYLPMLMKEDPAWNLPDPWYRPRPQVAQWALSHAVYPGLVFAKDDPIVLGHIALMQACTQEDVPAETGWLAHEGVWTYNAAFVSHVYLWAGVSGWAERTFRGFLNHASPLYCWREEQPLRHSLVAQYWGDMPHNWASAECVLYLRNRYVLEDGPSLRMLPSLPLETAHFENTPTRFGRLNVRFTKEERGASTLEFTRGPGPAPARIELPAQVDGRELRRIQGAHFSREGNSILVDPTISTWVAGWNS